MEHLKLAVLLIASTILLLGAQCLGNQVCPWGQFRTHLMNDCVDWLQCQDMAHLPVGDLLGYGAVKKIYESQWSGQPVALVFLHNPDYIEDFQTGLNNLKALGGKVATVVQLMGYCETSNVYATELHRHGDATNFEKYLETFMYSKTSKNYDVYYEKNMKRYNFEYNSDENLRRFTELHDCETPRSEDAEGLDFGVASTEELRVRMQFCMRYVEILSQLHQFALGPMVMCDSNTLEKTLQQYLLSDDHLLVLGDTDALPVVVKRSSKPDNKHKLLLTKSAFQKNKHFYNATSPRVKNGLTSSKCLNEKNDVINTKMSPLDVKNVVTFDKSNLHFCKICSENVCYSHLSAKYFLALLSNLSSNQCVSVNGARATQKGGNVQIKNLIVNSFTVSEDNFLEGNNERGSTDTSLFRAQNTINLDGKFSHYEVVLNAVPTSVGGIRCGERALEGDFVAPEQRSEGHEGYEQEYQQYKRNTEKKLLLLQQHDLEQSYLPTALHQQWQHQQYGELFPTSTQQQSQHERPAGVDSSTCHGAGRPEECDVTQEEKHEQAPTYDEKTDIYKVPEVCRYFLGSSGAAAQLLERLQGIHTACTHNKPHNRPTAAQILQAYACIYRRIRK